jgi:hypothetical protein
LSTTFLPCRRKQDIGIKQCDARRSFYCLQVRAECVLDNVAWLCETFAGKQEELSTSFSRTQNGLSPPSSGASDQVNLLTAGMIVEHPDILQAFAHRDSSVARFSAGGSFAMR